MNLKTTLLLLAVLVFAVAALLLTLREGTADPTTNEEQTPGTQPDPLILSESHFGSTLTSLAIDSDGEGDDLRLKLENGRWVVDLPHHFPANTHRLDELLTLLAELRGVPIDDQAVSSHPKKVWLTSGSDTVAIDLGDRLGGGRGVVFVSQGGTVQGYNVADTLHDFFSAIDLSTFYDNAIPPLLMPEIGRIELASSVSQSALYQDDGRWWIEHDGNAERALDQSLPGGPDGEGYPGINAYFRLLQSVELLQNQPYDTRGDLELFGLHNPLATVRFVPLSSDPSDDGAGWVLRVGLSAGVTEDADGNTRQTRFISYGRASDRNPPVFSTYSDTALLFAQDATYFRDPRIVTLQSTLIASLELSAPDRPGHVITFNSDGSVSESIADAEPTELSRTAAGRLLANLTGARALAYVEQGPEGLPLLMSVRMTARLGNRPEAFTLYEDPTSDPDTPTVLVRRADEPVMLRIARSAVDGLIDPSMLRDRP